ncbi:uncharacterized protein LOC122882433 isoform X2 [Siniperca chuatsi]|uniref:uncharacterized protein LOC122882433 isoform X2 n=1 Tax=Siniperca chuatsi TaxID=119488 RepID=UPI001CE1E9F6|nr:uncharacterized protein LOC122882433 isoform X2 [Siniperca chuatsi]
MSLPSSFCVSTPPSSPPFSPLPSWQQCQSGQAERGKHSAGQSRGRSKGWRIDYVRTHASRRGLWEGGVAHRGCAPLFSFPFFPPSRPSSPPVLRPSPPLTYRLQTGRRKDRPSPLLSDLRGSTEPERCCCVQDSYLCGSLMLKQHGCCPWG